MALLALYNSTQEKVVEELHAVTYFSVTTDMWSSIGIKSYISCTIHFIDHQWNLKNRCLQTQFLPEDHTAEVLSEAMEATLETWNLIATKQVCLTTDNGC